MVSLESLLGLARIGLTQCPDVTILDALGNAAQRFCKGTLAWQDDISPVVLVADANEYCIKAVTCARILRIIGANIDDDRRTPVDVARWVDLSAQREATGMPNRVALSLSYDKVHVWPTPTTTEAGTCLMLRAAFAPALDSDGLPSRVFGDNYRALIAAAKAELMATPNTAWYNPKEAVRQESIYGELEADAKREVLSGHGAELRVSYRPFA